MNQDFNFMRTLGADPSIFHTLPLTFYLDKENLDKEVTSCLGFTKEKKISGVSNMIPAISQRLTMIHKRGVGPRTTTSKREIITHNIRQ
jgi:hypothetical protein